MRECHHCRGHDHMMEQCGAWRSLTCHDCAPEFSRGHTTGARLCPTKFARGRSPARQEQGHRRGNSKSPNRPTGQDNRQPSRGYRSPGGRTYSRSPARGTYSPGRGSFSPRGSSRSPRSPAGRGRIDMADLRRSLNHVSSFIETCSTPNSEISEVALVNEDSWAESQ